MSLAFQLAHALVGGLHVGGRNTRLFEVPGCARPLAVGGCLVELRLQRPAISQRFNTFVHRCNSRSRRGLFCRRRFSGRPPRIGATGQEHKQKNNEIAHGAREYPTLRGGV